ncbi:SDR family oxidoreductase [Bordetella genomosp. 5]|uniref:3-ketoacyl-ACP reductase n=1 Tax=Bordetella genomosp. 5 TaxID=1395608 RepID=A0A261TVC2_9BORD|nr:SDR family oxidoreductase [Bordetella genomosp. 5]OZI53616.1 3-ketoacyl-ACP reductase [Bordetella genomosp. 5]
MNKVALVTGAASGIGFATGVALLEAGHTVYFTDRNATDLDRIDASLRERARAVTLDLQHPDEQQKVTSDVLARHGAIDILVNNAGISIRGANGQPQSLLDATEAQFFDMMRINTLALMQMTQRVLPGMMHKRWGRIVNVASLAGRSKSIVSGPLYMMSKSAVLGLTRATAAEMGPHGITCNAVAPGRVLSAMTENAAPGVNEGYAEQIPVRRIGQPVEIAAGIAYLCSEHAGFTNGAVIDINGGFFMS